MDVSTSSTQINFLHFPHYNENDPHRLHHMAAASSVTPLSAATDPLSHPLFSNSIIAATRGSYANAFRGIAALIDEEEQQEQESDCDEATDTPQHDQSPHRSNSAPLAPHSITWTRPSAIRIAKLKQEAEERMRRTGEETKSKSQHRTKPYEKRRQIQHQRQHSHHSHSTHVSPKKLQHSSSDAASSSSPSASSSANIQLPSPGFPSASSSGSYGAIRSHARHRSHQSTHSSSGPAARMTIKSMCDDPFSSSNLAASSSSRARSSAVALDTSAGETTMLMKMWKM